MTTTEYSFDLRRPGNDDFDATLALMVRCDIKDYGEPDTDPEDLQHDWESLDIDRDAWLAHSAAGEVVGYGAVIPGRVGHQIDVYVDPIWRGAKLAGSLLARCLNRADQRIREANGPLEFRVYSYLAHSNKFDLALFERAGFRPERYHFQMDITLDTPPPAPEFPAGLMLRTAVPGQDDLGIHRLIEAAFARPGRTPATLEEWRHHMMRPELLDPDLWFLTVAGDEIVGACLAFVYPGQGWVRQLAVADGWRRQGIATSLLLHAFRVFIDRGLTRAGLTVAGDNPGAASLYEHVGMNRLRQYDEYAMMHQVSARA